MRPRPLPPELVREPFRARDSGLSRKRLRASDLDRSVRGVRLAGTADDLRTRCAMFQLRLRDEAFFSHSTAALLLDAPLPFAIEKSPVLHAAVPAPRPSPHAHGIAGHSLRVVPGDVVASHGIRHSSAARTWADLASMLSLDDLIAVGDHLIHWRMPLATRAELGAVLDRLAGQRGIRRAREALSLLSDKPESRPESLLRLIVLRSGLPEPRINHTIVSSETGRQVRPDFLFHDQMLILEYQGDYHRTRAQWRKDLTRRSRLEAQGWHVMELGAEDLHDPRELTERIGMLLARRR